MFFHKRKTHVIRLEIHMAALTQETVDAIVAELNTAASAISAHIASAPTPIDDTALKAAVAAVVAAIPVA